MTLTDEMRLAADILEKVSRQYGWKDPASGEWSAKQLRYEANQLDKPIAKAVSNWTESP
jgi:hypothetical protein